MVDNCLGAIMGITIKSDSGGKHSEITLDKTGTDTGTVNVKTWNNGPNHAGNPPDKDEKTRLYAITAKSNGSKIVCKADVPGSDPDVAFVVAGSQSPSVTVTIVGTTFGLGDGTNVYPITQSDLTKITQFVASAGFPITA
jgi:hypothetical protein